MRRAVRGLVVLDDDEGGEEEGEGEQVQRGVGEGAAPLLGRRVRRLQDEEGFDGEEDRGRVEERVQREEREGVQEDGEPD